MRYFLVYLRFVLHACCLSDQPAKPLSAADSFTLRATVVESMEGGPLVINVVLQNRRNQAVEISGEPWRCDEINVRSSAQWEGRVMSRRDAGNPLAYRTISPGEEWSETLFLHHHYCNITSGRVRLSLSWPLYASSKDRPLLAEPTATLDVVIPPATAERLAKLQKRLEERIKRPGLTKTEGYQIADLILDTRHTEFLPVAWQMLEIRPWLFRVQEVIYFIHDRAGMYHETQDRFVMLACGPVSKVKQAIFDYWSPRPRVLNGKQINRLRTAKSIWTNVRTYLIFANQHEALEKDEFFIRVRALNKPVFDPEFARLLRNLDDDIFELREKASADLEATGERVEEQLRRSLSQPLSAEAARRVRAILDKLKDAKQPPDCVDTLAYLKNLDTPESQQVLEALAEGTANTWLRKEARSILDGKKKR